MTKAPHRLFKLINNHYLITPENKDKFFNKLICGGFLKITDNVESEGIEQGHTYLGQMIAHDIVPSTNIFKSEENFVSASLNLDSIYGNNKRPAHFDKYGKFILGYAIDKVSGEKLYGNDLLRGKNGQALIPERRNDENLIISQLHLFWQKIHNKVIQDLIDEFPDINHFKHAKIIVTKIFHEIIIHDYLRQILHPDIYSLYFEREFSFLYDSTKQIKEIPIEFSRAVFRFGHSMIRSNYDLNNKSIENKNTTDMLSNRDLYLDGLDIIDWSKFFTSVLIMNSKYHNHLDNYKLHNESRAKINQNSKQFTVTFSASKIDTNIVSAMANVPFIKNTFDDIRKINLNADFIKDESINGLGTILNILKTNDQIKLILNHPNYSNDKIYLEEKFLQLPLWPYVLIEAEKSCFRGLGLIGSIITVEVIKSSIRSALNKQSDINDTLYNHILNKIKASQLKIDKNYIDGNRYSVLASLMEKLPIQMGYCINYLK